MQISDAIIAEVKKENLPSAFSLSRIILDKDRGGEKDLLLPGYKNLIIWTNLQGDFVDAVSALLVEKKIFALPTDPIVVMMDGAAIDLPVAEAVRDYEVPTWLPVVFSGIDNPNAAEALSPDNRKRFGSIFDSLTFIIPGRDKQ